MNREGKLYRSDNNAIFLLVLRSQKWSPQLDDAMSNYTHICMVLDCPSSPRSIGNQLKIDERLYTSKDAIIQSSWDVDYHYEEI